MKKITTLFLKKSLICLFILIAVISCKKNNQTSAPGTSSGNFSFKLDGTAITIDSANAVLYSTTNGKQMNIYTYKGGDKLTFTTQPQKTDDATTLKTTLLLMSGK